MSVLRMGFDCSGAPAHAGSATVTMLAAIHGMHAGSTSWLHYSQLAVELPEKRTSSKAMYQTASCYKCPFEVGQHYTTVQYNSTVRAHRKKHLTQSPPRCQPQDVQSIDSSVHPQNSDRTPRCPRHPPHNRSPVPSLDTAVAPTMILVSCAAAANSSCVSCSPGCINPVYCGSASRKALLSTSRKTCRYRQLLVYPKLATEPHGRPRHPP